MFESCKNTVVSTASLCLAVCIFHVMNKAGMSARSIYYIMSQYFRLFISKKQTNMAAL